MIYVYVPAITHAQSLPLSTRTHCSLTIISDIHVRTGAMSAMSAVMSAAKSQAHCITNCIAHYTHYRCNAMSAMCNEFFAMQCVMQ